MFAEPLIRFENLPFSLVCWVCFCSFQERMLAFTKCFFHGQHSVCMHIATDSRPSVWGSDGQWWILRSHRRTGRRDTALGTGTSTLCFCLQCFPGGAHPCRVQRSLVGPSPLAVCFASPFLYRCKQRQLEGEVRILAF